jgi:hypothetical protein
LSAWTRGLSRHPLKVDIAGSNPAADANSRGHRQDGLSRLPFKEEIVSSNLTGPTKFGSEALKAKHSALNRERGVRFSTDPPSCSGVAKLVKRLTVNQVICRFESCPRSQIKAVKCTVHGESYKLRSPRSGRRPGSTPGTATMPGLSSGDGSCPTNRPSRVRSSAPVPFWAALIDGDELDF